MPDQMWERGKKIVLADQHFMMPRLDMVRYGARKGKFAVSLFGIADGKSLDGLAPYFRHQRGHRARIHAATQEYAERHVAHQVTADCALEQLAITLDVVPLISRFVRRRCI